MLFLIFKAGENEYALETDRVLRIVPCVKLRPSPDTPVYIDGIMNFQGTPVAVVDLNTLLNHTPCKRFLSTRIIVTEYTTHKAGQKLLLGLMAEGVTALIKKDVSDLMENALTQPGLNYLGKVFRKGERLIQIIKFDEIVPVELENMLIMPAL